MLKLHDIRSADIEPPNLPEDPFNCCVNIQLSIGSAGDAGSDIFQFDVVTPAWLAENCDPRWGRGLLVVPMFSWETVRDMVARLLASTPSELWLESAISLSRTLNREF